MQTVARDNLTGLPPIGRRSGVTLLELLVVILILLMITAAAIPLIAPALDNRRMREASRLASTFISGARSRAIQTGRETGVQFLRFNGNPYATTLAYVEVPPAYGGDTVGSACTVMALPTAPPATEIVAPPAGFNVVQWFDVTMIGTFNYAMARMYDQIQFGYQGPLYTILGPDSNTDGVADSGQPLHVALITSTGTTTVNWPWSTTTASAQMPYQIFRQPVRTSDTPLQLPEGIVFDLLQSGVGLTNTLPFYNAMAIPAQPWTSTWPTTWSTNPPAPFDPIVTFTPNGAVGHVVTSSIQRPTGSIYLLLGRRELVPDVAFVNSTKAPEDKNIYDSDTPTPENAYMQNFWISVGYQTGLVSVTENARNLGPIADPTNFLTNARTYALTAQSIGGR